jgi:lysophospholipase L1-like esterase
LAIEKLPIGGNNKMKFKRLSVLLTLMLAFSTFFTSFAFAEENIDKPNLVALGDSISFGYKLEDNQTQPSPNAFPSLVAPGEFDVTNLGVPGWTSSDLLIAMNTNTSFSAAIKAADFITLNIGNNDLLQAVGINEIIANPGAVDQMAIFQKVIPAADLLKQNLTAIITKIKAENPTAPIVLYNIYNPFGESTDPVFGLLHNISKQIIHDGVQNLPGINQLYAVADQVPGIYLADAYSAFDGNQADYIFGAPKDLIHPNAAGHQVLAGLATEILISLLPEPEELTVEITAPTEETPGSVTIEVLTNAEEVLSMMWLEGEQTVESFYDEEGIELGTKIIDNKFEISKNGTYSVYVLDGYGQETVEFITINNIKETPVENPKPTPTPTPTPTPVTNTPAPTPTGTGHAIPNTASPAYNLMALGSVVLLAGFVTLKIQRRRKQEI